MLSTERQKDVESSMRGRALPLTSQWEDPSTTDSEFSLPSQQGLHTTSVIHKSNISWRRYCKVEVDFDEPFAPVSIYTLDPFPIVTHENLSHPISYEVSLIM